MEPHPPSEHPWDIQPNEDRDWHYRFRLFVLQGPTRSLTKAYVAWLEDQGEPVPDDLLGPPALWRSRSREYDWEERAFAWDQHQILLRERDLLAWKTKERERRQSVLDTLFGRMVKLTETEVMDATDLKRAAEAAKLYLDQSREETGDTIQQREPKPPGKPAAKPDTSGQPETQSPAVDLEALLDEYLDEHDLREVAKYGPGTAEDDKPSGS